MLGNTKTVSVGRNVAITRKYTLKILQNNYKFSVLFRMIARFPGLVRVISIALPVL